MGGANIQSVRNGLVQKQYDPQGRSARVEMGGMQGESSGNWKSGGDEGTRIRKRKQKKEVGQEKQFHPFHNFFEGPSCPSAAIGHSAV